MYRFNEKQDSPRAARGVRLVRVARRRRDRAGSCRNAFLCLLFLIVGGTAFYYMTYRPLSAVLDASDWKPIPCTIVSSAVQRNERDKNDTFSVAIEYEYVFRGQRYRANRYDFVESASTNRASQLLVVDQYPVGKRVTAYVDPSDPTQAVLVREFTDEMWWGLFPLPIMVIGIFWLASTVVGSLRRRGTRPSRKSREYAVGRPFESYKPASHERAQAQAAIADDVEDDVDDDVDDDDEFDYDDSRWQPLEASKISADPVTLKPAMNRWTTFIALLVIGTIWNGLIGVALVHAITGLWHGSPEWPLILILLPFLAIGLALLWGMVYTFLQTFNPVPTLTLSAGAAPLGAELELTWRFSGITSRLKRMEIQLRGREEATYRRGTSNTTDKHTFAEIKIVDTTDPIAIESGQTTLHVPTHSMHSFDSGHNRVVWSLHIRGDIAYWPDVSEEYPIVVLPHIGILDLQS